VARPTERSSTYSFGDNGLAADRLALVAEVFGPVSAKLLDDATPGDVELALDLGCGPGYTTRLVAERTQAARTIGLDASPAFVERARRQLGPGLEFRVHDVTRMPLPVTGADVIFGRYLLAHLPEPLSLLEQWANELPAGGRLLLEEVEDIATDDDVFERYLDIVSKMLEHRGTDLHVGRVLGERGDSVEASLVLTRPVEVTPRTSVVAAMFGMNLASWRDDSWVVDNVSDRELASLAEQLDDRRSLEGTGTIMWTHRQVAYERAP
jgi:SAM-dependent methyltransferase